jgi:hypothetical protein
VDTRDAVPKDLFSLQSRTRFSTTQVVAFITVFLEGVWESTRIAAQKRGWRCSPRQRPPAKEGTDKARATIMAIEQFMMLHHRDKAIITRWCAPLDSLPAGVFRG